MSEIIRIDSDESDNSDISSINTDLIGITEEMLSDTRMGLTNANTLSMPIAQLATLGAGVSSLLPSLRTVTQTITTNASGLFRLANDTVGDTLKVAKNGNYWGALKTADGASKLAQFQSAPTQTATSQTVSAINPATLMMAVALFSIEQKLGEINEMQRQILSFLEVEKESEIEADVETLSNIMSKYKLNWDNKHYVTGNHKMVLDIQRTARKNMLSYQKKVSEIVKGKKLIVVQSQVNAALKDLLKKLKYYRLSLYTFSMASMMEIMLSGNFDEEYITGIKEEIEKLSHSYRELFGECSVYLEKMGDVSVETNVLKGLASASKAFGKFIGSIPVVKEGSVDEFFQDMGTQMNNNADSIENSALRAFDEVSSPQTHVFVERMEDLIHIYNHTEQIYFDDKRIYLVAG